MNVADFARTEPQLVEKCLSGLQERWLTQPYATRLSYPGREGGIALRALKWQRRISMAAIRRNYQHAEGWHDSVIVTPKGVDARAWAMKLRLLGA